MVVGRIVVVGLLLTAILTFRVHYSIHGDGRDIYVQAENSSDARYTVQDMFPDCVVTGVSEVRRR